MTKVELESLLATVGKEKFINYFYGFKEVYSDDGKNRLAEEMVKNSEKSVKTGGELTRINCAKKIIDAGLAMEALQLIIDSNASDEIKSAAQEIKMAEKISNIF